MANGEIRLTNGTQPCWSLDDFRTRVLVGPDPLRTDPMTKAHPVQQFHVRNPKHGINAVMARANVAGVMSAHVASTKCHDQRPEEPSER